MQAIYKTSLALALTLIGFCSLASAQTKEAAGQLDAEMAKFFEKSHSALDNALAEFDNAQDLPENSELAPYNICLLYTSPSPRDRTRSRMPSSA